MKNTGHILTTVFTTAVLSAFFFNQATLLDQLEGVVKTIHQVQHTFDSANQTFVGVRGTVYNFKTAS